MPTLWPDVPLLAAEFFVSSGRGQQRGLAGGPHLRAGAAVDAIAQHPNPMAPPPTSEAVQTSVHPYGNLLLVSLLSGAPFVPSASRIMSVDPTSGTFTELPPQLSSTIATLFR